MTGWQKEMTLLWQRRTQLFRFVRPQGYPILITGQRINSTVADKAHNRSLFTSLKRRDMEHAEDMEDMSMRHEHRMGMPLPASNKLHVVLHGLICMRLSYATRTVQLHFPSVAMHVYHFGTFGNLQILEYGQDYEIGGVQVGHFQPDATQIQQEHLAIRLQDYPGLGYSPRGVHATVTLPWPANVRGVRKISN